MKSGGRASGRPVPALWTQKLDPPSLAQTSDLRPSEDTKRADPDQRVTYFLASE